MFSKNRNRLACTHIQYYLVSILTTWGQVTALDGSGKLHRGLSYPNSPHEIHHYAQSALRALHPLSWLTKSGLSESYVALEHILIECVPYEPRSRAFWVKIRSPSTFLDCPILLMPEKSKIYTGIEPRICLQSRNLFIRSGTVLEISIKRRVFQYLIHSDTDVKPNFTPCSQVLR